VTACRTAPLLIQHPHRTFWGVITMISKDTKEGFILMFAYSGILAVATVICAFIGYEIDELFGSAIGVTLSIGMFFIACWLCWMLAVRFTQPKSVLRS
jgi:hypothetical protein